MNDILRWNTESWQQVLGCEELVNHFKDIIRAAIDGDFAGINTAVFGPSRSGSLPVVDRDVSALTALKFTQALSENFLVYGGKFNTVDNLQQPFMRGRGLDAGFMNGAFDFTPILEPAETSLVLGLRMNIDF